MVPTSQSKHDIDFSWTRKHPFVSAFDSPGMMPSVASVENRPQLRCHPI